MTNQICYVVGAGELYPEDAFTPTADDIVIAADGGCLHLKERNIRPDVVVGDFDSSSLSDCQWDDVPTIVHPREKDATDMTLAVQTGLERGFRTFVLYGGTGGRVDHTYANLQTLHMLSRHQSIGYLVGSRHVYTVLSSQFPGGLTVPGRDLVPPNQAPWLPTGNGYLSIFAFTERAVGVTLRGLKYPLEDATLHNDDPLGVSNEFIGEPASITLDEGALLIIWEKP